MRGTKKKNSFRRTLRKKRLLALLSILVVVSAMGFVGVKLYPPFRSLADTSVRPNPPFAYTCGFNVMIEIDTSSSRGIELVNLDKQHIQSFMNAFNGTDTLFSFTVSSLNDDVWVPYTSDKSKIIDAMNEVDTTGGTTDINLKSLVQYANYRPSKQTIIMIFTDGGDPDRYDGDYSEPSNQLKASGARIIAFVLPGGKVNLFDVQKITGPNIDTGNILTSDVVHNSDYASLTTQLNRFVSIDSCNPPPPGPTPSGPGGPSGPGPGNGNDNGGTGPGTNGQGAGGGGGSSAMTEAEKPKATPSTTAQGESTEQPKTDPSPFFDGKLFAAGSDTDNQNVNGISIAGRKFGYGWFYLVGVLLLTGSIIAGYVLWWKKLAPKEQSRLKRKLLLEK